MFILVSKKDSVIVGHEYSADGQYNFSSSDSTDEYDVVETEDNIDFVVSDKPHKYLNGAIVPA